uniref:Uncharacterized protein n=1 Tax=viral metagenome TaxID=1070528 RepID=A0A6M3XP60_9ZZZZ
MSRVEQPRFLALRFAIAPVNEAAPRHSIGIGCRAPTRENDISLCDSVIDIAVMSNLKSMRSHRLELSCPPRGSSEAKDADAGSFKDVRKTLYK